MRVISSNNTFVLKTKFNHQHFSIQTDPKDFAKVIRKIGDRVIIQREETKYQYSLGKYE